MISFTKMGALAMSAALVVVFAAEADARERRRTGSFQGSNGISGKFEQNVIRDRGTLQRNTVIQGQNGGTFQRQRNRQVNKETQSIDTTIVNQGPNGNQRIVNQNTRRNEDGSITTDRYSSGTGGFGAEGTRTYVPNGDGTGGSVSGSYENNRGRSLDWQGTINRDENGVTRQGDYQAGNGNSGTYTGSFTPTDNGFTRSQTFTNQDGVTRGRDITGAWDPDTRTYTKTITATDAQGEQRTRSIDVTIDPPTE